MHLSSACRETPKSVEKTQQIRILNNKNECKDGGGDKGYSRSKGTAKVRSSAKNGCSDSPKRKGDREGGETGIRVIVRAKANGKHRYRIEGNSKIRLIAERDMMQAWSCA